VYGALNIEVLSLNHCCSGNAISITYSECVTVVLVIQHAKRMRRILLSSVVCPALPYFSALSHRRHVFREKKLLNLKFEFLIFSEIFLIVRRTERDVIINVQRYPLLLSYFNET
jgi:hypothetical protein